MQAAVMPICPYCGSRYVKYDSDRITIATPTKAVLITCNRCKEKYYVYAQTRYIARRSLA